MSEMTSFLLDRIDEDEECARDAAGWDATGAERAQGRWSRHGVNSVTSDESRLVVFGDGDAPSGAQADHIARFDPTRVLAECEAKRAIVEMHADEIPGDCAEVRWLASVYADHPYYREEWRP